MKHFTKEQIEEIRIQLATKAVRDSDFDETFSIQDEDFVPILQGEKNKRISAGNMFGPINEEINGMKATFVTRLVDDLINYYTKEELYSKDESYSKEEIDELIRATQNFHYEVYANRNLVRNPSPNVLYLIGPVLTPEGSEIDDLYQEWVYWHSTWTLIGTTGIELSTKQDKLVSGENIKTVNGQSIVGSGNLEVGDLNAVKFIQQILTPEQKEQSRTNIGAGTYSLPSGGVPKTDLSQSVQTSLDTADSAYQKPNSGVPKTDLASGVQSSLDLADSSVQANPVGSVTPAVDPYDYATREELSQLGQKVDGGNTEIFDELVFEQGGISTTNGSNQTSLQQVRSDFIVTPSLRVTVTNGSVYVYGWNGDTYLSAVGWKTGTNDFEIAGATKYKLVFKLPSGNLTPAGVGDLGASVYVPIRGEVVKCVSQTLNGTEKQTARENIGAEEAGRLDPYVLGGYVPMDISDVQERGVSIDGSNNHYRVSNGTTNKSASKAIPIQPGKSYKVINVVSDASYYAVLKDITNIGVSDSTPHYATGYSARVNIPANDSDTFISPVDGYYLFVLVKNGAGNDYEPDVFENEPGIDARVTTVEENVVELDVRVSNLEGGSENTSIRQVFENIQIPVDVNGYEIPVTFGMNAALKKAAQGNQIKYVAKKAYPTLTDPTGAAAGEKTGFPYSSVKEMAKFIHWHVSERTFMTAINNEYGLFYTEDVANNNSRSDYGYTYHGVNCGPYYGMVCNIFALWCLGYPVPFDTAQFAYLASKGVLVRLNNQTAQTVHICDLVWYQGHTALITSVKHDGYGNVTEVKITESMGHVHETTFTAAQFETYLHITHDAILYRPTFVYKNTYQPSEFIGVRGEATPSAYEYNDDICFFAGDYAAWKLGENAWVNYTKGSFTGMKIYKDDTLVATITLDNDSSVHKVNVTSYINGAGKYKACLTDGTNDSDFTYWQMVEATVSYSNGVVSFDSANGIPWYIQVCRSNGGAYCWYEITKDDIEAGEVELNLAAMIAEQYGPVAGTQYVRVAFKADYGAVVSDMIQI